MDLQTQERRGEDAKRLLNEDLFKEAWQMVRERIVLMLEHPNTPPAERERLNHALVGLRDAKRYVEQVMATGTMVAMEIERKRTIAERLLRR